MKKAFGKAIAVFVLGIGGGILGSQILWPYMVEKPLFFKYRLWENPTRIVEKKEVHITDDTQLKNIIPQVSKSVVSINIQTKEGKSYRTGVIVTSDGVIAILSRNIPKDYLKITVSGNNFSEDAKVLKNAGDVTFLKINRDNLPAVSFPGIEEIFLGEKVFYLSELNEDKLKSGISLGVGFITRVYSNHYLLTNLAEDKEEIGAPLFNLKGEFLGITFLGKDEKAYVIPFSKIKESLKL